MYKEKLRTIDEITARFNTHPEYSGCILREKYNALGEEAEKHSLAIELTSEAGNDELANERKEIINGNKERKKFLWRLQKAEEYLLKDGINHISLSKLGNMIAPKNHSYVGFRRVGGVLIHRREGSSFVTPEPKEIMPQIMDLIEFLREPSFHPIVRASNAHLEIVRIHPYEDGNGRTARLLQNLCLQERGYPPAIIRADEKRKYFEVIGNVWEDRIKKDSSVCRPSESEEQFYDFIASKVLDSALEAEEELKNRRTYNVNLKNYENFGIVRSVAAALRASGKIENKGISVSMDKRNGGKKGSILRITGDIGQDELRQKLEKFSKRYGFNFQTELNPKKSC